MTDSQTDYKRNDLVAELIEVLRHPAISRLTIDDTAALLIRALRLEPLARYPQPITHPDWVCLQNHVHQTFGAPALYGPPLAELLAEIYGLAVVSVPREMKEASRG